jgi:hypothetical protein
LKHPNELKQRLAQQWQNPDLRSRRLLNAGEWPLSLPIGIPSAGSLERPATLREHIQRWKMVSVGRVEWTEKSYRKASAPLAIPVYWVLDKPSEWIAACEQADIEQEFQHLAQIIAAIDPLFHDIILRQRQQVMTREADDIILAGKVALALSPRCAEGKPLRALSIEGCDSKFFERFRQLLILMLSARYGDTVKALGLEAFLDAADDADHWLLVAPLNSALLPFTQQRVRASELFNTPLPASRILIVENEKCLYQLPVLPYTIAILGAGLHLNWLSAEWLLHKQVGYWGDIDTWGLCMLATARKYLPRVTPLLMNRESFDQVGRQAAVCEPENAGEDPPETLTTEESALYRHLLSLEKGRLEQEFLPERWVHCGLKAWHEDKE